MTRPTRPDWSALLALLMSPLLGCDAPPASGRPTHATTTASGDLAVAAERAEEATHGAPDDERERTPIADARGFSVHEWGLIDVGARGAELAARAVPGRPPPRRETIATPAKPVLYVHLAEGVDELRIDLGVRIPGGAILEHWPLTQTIEDGVSWSIVARRESCRGGPYPRVTDRVCRLADLCEAAELALYETREGACLEHGDQRHNLLFYRGRGPAAPLPLDVSVGARGVVTVRRRALPYATGDFPLLRVIRDDGDVRVVPARLEGAHIELPHLATRGRCPRHDPTRDGRGHSCDEVRAMEIADAVADFDAVFARSGLTPGERAAFERAWNEELVRPGPAGVRDAILYWLPTDAADAIMPLTIEPAPTAVRRAHLVRVDLRR
ncbi:MAG: hypothetical protein KF901_29115 [Myxococcales bacterium]|nr:hypothetical protein [Myxococcales bacterium]